jgi:hypothetical protein
MIELQDIFCEHGEDYRKTHRVAISNNRLVFFDNGYVTFKLLPFSAQLPNPTLFRKRINKSTTHYAHNKLFLFSLFQFQNQLYKQT